MFITWPINLLNSQSKTKCINNQYIGFSISVG